MIKYTDAAATLRLLKICGYERIPGETLFQKQWTLGKLRSFFTVDFVELCNSEVSPAYRLGIIEGKVSKQFTEYQQAMEAIRGEGAPKND